MSGLMGAMISGGGGVASFSILAGAGANSQTGWSIPNGFGSVTSGNTKVGIYTLDSVIQNAAFQLIISFSGTPPPTSRVFTLKLLGVDYLMQWVSLNQWANASPSSRIINSGTTYAIQVI